MDTIVSYLVTYWQPLSGLLIGALLVAIYMNLYTNRRRNIIPWISSRLFRNQLMSERSAEGLFDVATSFLLMVGGLWLLLAIYYLTNGRVD